MRTPGLKYRTMSKDRYDRALLRMETPRGDVGETMIAGGYARVYQGGYCRRDSPRNIGEAGGKKGAALDACFAGNEGPQSLFAGRMLPFDENAALI